MWRLSRIASWYLMNRGFSIGLGDVTPSKSLLKMKSDLVQNGYDKCDDLIRQLDEGLLASSAGHSEEEVSFFIFIKLFVYIYSVVLVLSNF